MKAQDLRIGNYVTDHLGRTQKVAETRSDAYICYLSNGAKLKYKLNTTHPIPLTEEWLVKFGFQRHDEGSVSAQFSYGTNPVTQDYIIYLKWIKDYENDYQLNGFPFYQNGHFEIKTVHQLQNLYFALVGEELELKPSASSDTTLSQRSIH